MTIELVMPSKHLIFCRPLLFLPSVFPSTRVFSNESDLHVRWPKYWSFSFSISPSNEYLGLISFRTDWFDLHAVQGTLKSSPATQFKSINSSALSLLCGPTLTSGVRRDWASNTFWLHRHLLAKWCLCFLIHCLGLSSKEWVYDKEWYPKISCLNPCICKCYLIWKRGRYD